MNLVYLGLWRKLAEVRNAWRFNVSKRMATQVTSLVLGLLVAAAISTSARIALHQGANKALEVMAGNFAALTALTVVFTFSRALNDIFMAQDFEVLAAAPLSHMEILLVRISEMAVSNIPMALVFAFPSMAILVPFAATGLFLPLGLVFVALQVVTITALSSLVLLALTTFAPPRFLRQVVYVVWTGGFLTFYLWANLRLGTPGADPLGHFSRLNKSSLAVLSAWAFRGTANFFSGNLRAGAFYLLAITATAMAAVLVSARFLAHSTFAGRAAFIGGGAVRVRSRGMGFFAVLPVNLRAVAEKEILTFLRDVRELTGILYALTLVVLFAWRMPGVGGAVGFAVLPTALFAGNFQIRTSLPAFGREGKMWLLVQSAPLSSKDLVYAKFAAWGGVSAASSGLLALVLGIMGRQSFFTLLFLAGNGICVGFVSAAVALHLGAKYADFEAERPEEYVMSAGRWMALLATLAIAGGAWFISLPLEQCSTILGYVLASAILGLVTVLMAARELAACERIISERLISDE